MAPASRAAQAGKPSSLLDTRVVYCGDNLEQLTKLPDKCIDLVYIDPPFNSKRNYFQIYNNQGSEDRAQAQAFVVLDDELRTRALALIAHDPAGFLSRGLARSVQLWAGDVPVRPEQAGAGITALWIVVNLVFLMFGLAGAVLLARRGGPFASLPLVIVVATWVLSYPLWAEGRFSLPARPFLGIGLAALVGHFVRERRV